MACWRCQCSLTDNFFVDSYKVHVDFDGCVNSLLAVLRGHVPEEELDACVQEVRRQSAARLVQLSAAGRLEAELSARYQRRHLELWQGLRPEWVHPSLYALASELRAGTLTNLDGFAELRCLRTGLYMLPVFSADFCGLLCDELANVRASGLPRSRPNNMLTQGVVLRELGLAPLMDELLALVIGPLARALLPDCVDGCCGLDSQRSFVTHYSAEAGGDKELTVHVDNSEVTLNLNIGGEWCGGELACLGNDDGLAPELLVRHRQGYGVLHAGSEVHRAEPLTEGWRDNLVVLCRSSPVRNRRCPRCGEPPRLVDTDAANHEGFQPLTKARRRLRQRARRGRKARSEATGSPDEPSRSTIIK